MTNRVRTFVACVLDAAATERVARLATDVRTFAEQRGARATWVKKENLHVSMKFLGDVSKERLAAIGEALRAIAARHAPIELVVSGVGAFPPHGKPRVLYAAIERGAEALAKIAMETEEALAALGFPREPKAFRPHVTIARVKLPKRNLLPEKIDAPGAARVSSLTLFTSDLTPAGPVYRVVSDSPLSG